MADKFWVGGGSSTNWNAAANTNWSDTNGGAPAKQELEQFVQRKVVQAYQPEMDWAALARAIEHVMRQAAEEAERIEQEIEDEDEMVLMMAV